MPLIEKYPRLAPLNHDSRAITIIWRRAAKNLTLTTTTTNTNTTTTTNGGPAPLPSINADYLPFYDYIDQRKNVRIEQTFLAFLARHRATYTPPLVSSRVTFLSGFFCCSLPFPRGPSSIFFSVFVTESTRNNGDEEKSPFYLLSYIQRHIRRIK